MTPEQEEHFLVPQVDFNIPLPRFTCREIESDIVGAQVNLSETHDGKIVRLKFLDLKARHPSTFQLTLDHPNAIRLAKFISNEIPQAGILGKSDYCTATEAADGNLFLMLSPTGRIMLEQESNVEFLLDAIVGTKLQITTDRIHDTLLPPFITLEDRTWYHRNTIRLGVDAFRDELLANGWLKMLLYKG
jgi:hypothetical protein